MKKLSAIFLVLAMLLCVMPTAALADDPCANGHTLDLTDPVENDPLCVNGYHEELYYCRECGGRYLADGSEAVWELATQEHTLSELHTVEDGEHSCGPCYEEDYRLCSTCGDGYTYEEASGQWIEAEAHWHNGTDMIHVPDMDNPQEDEITDCSGGREGTYYLCRRCDWPCYADGTWATWKTPLTGHTPKNEHPADYTVCEGGYKEVYYQCGICFQICDAEGNLLSPEEPVSEHVLEDEVHLAADEIHYCDGWYTEDYQLCIYCGGAFAETELGFDSAERQWEPDEGEEFIHRGTEALQQPNYFPCSGGFKEAWGQCDGCIEYVNADGELIEYYEPVSGAKHTPFLDITELVLPSCDIQYSSETFYVCECGGACDENGNAPEYSHPDAPAHDWVLHKAEKENHSNCGGWYDEDYYMCSKCREVCGVGTDGKPDTETTPEPNAPEGTELSHDRIHFPAKDNRKEFYVCWGCTSLSLDAEGKNVVEDYHNLIADGVPVTPEPPSDPTNPSTGDNSNVLLLIGIMFFSAVGLVTLVYCQKKHIF